MNFLGIEIGGTKLQVVAGTDRRVTERHQFQVDKVAGAEGIRAQILSVLPGLIKQHAPAAIGVGFGGPVDSKTGMICCSHHIAGWSEFPLAQWLTEKSGLPVKVENDADVAALGEYRCGSHAGTDPLFYITMGSGIGGGLVAGGAIYHGALPGQSEVGHLRMDREGRILESLCAGWAIDRKIRESRAANPKSILFELIGNETKGETRFLAAALEKGDPFARQLLDETAGTLAFGLSHVVHLFHPAVIILGGGVSLIGEPLRAAVAKALTPLVMEAFHPAPIVALSSLKEDAVPIGALLLAGQAGK